MEALHDVVRAGKARYLGASTMAAWQFAKAQATADRHGWTRFASMQNHYNLLYREEEREMIPLCIDQGVGVLPYSPLARGSLARPRASHGDPPSLRAEADPLRASMYGRPADLAVIDGVAEIASARGVAPARVALAWLLHQRGITAPIVGVTRIEQVEDAIAAAELALSPDELARLERPYEPHPLVEATSG
jgi:aryl-alcohol dehydrogenase-like predicted oxidoreductase